MDKLGPASKKQEMMLTNDADILICGGAAGGGKALRHGEPVLTPNGWVNIEDLSVGDTITSPSGSPEDVVAVYPQGITDIYRVTFQDGSYSDCSPDHLWSVTFASSKRKRTVMSVLDLEEYISSQNKRVGMRKYMPMIDLINPVEISSVQHDLPIHPYVLGFILGDGCITQGCVFCTVDKDIVDRIKGLGYSVNPIKDQKGGITYSILGISEELKDLGLRGKGSSTKFIPDVYLSASIEDRLEMIRGLMDSDGYAPKGKNSCQYTSVSKNLSDEMSYLVRSVGGTGTITSKIGSYIGKDGNRVYCKRAYTVHIRHRDSNTLFHLKRKRTSKGVPKLKNCIRSIERICKDYSTCISITGKDKLFITRNFLVTHNSFIMSMLPLRYIDCPNWNGIIFRRTTVQVSGQGGMFETARDMYSALPPDSKPRIAESRLKAVFPSGANLKFSHMEYTKNKLDHQGLQYSFIGFDEGTHFEFEQVEYLMSRLRSSSKYPSRMVISCNPDPDSFLLDMIGWFLDDDGYPDPDREGKLRYFIRRNSEFIWADTKEELVKEYGIKDIRSIKSLSFVSATIYDNPPCMEANPGYVGFLEGLNDVDKSRLLLGNWFARPEGSNYFERSWVTEIPKIPNVRMKWVRSWDKASTEPSDVTPQPDYTAGIKIGKDTDGNYYLVGDYHPSNHDKKLDIYGKFRKRPGERDNIIKNQALYDGHECTVIMPQDPGSAGVTEYKESAKKLISEGIICKKDPMPSQNSKLTRFTPFSAAAENGLVYVVTTTFDKKTLESLYKELESKTRKDD